MAIKVYRYGLLPPHENADLVTAQMRAAHRYRNTLTEIERGRRAARRAASTAHADVATCKAAFTKADDDLSAALLVAARHKSATRSGKVPEEIQMTIKEAREARRAAAKAFRESRVAQRGDAVALAEADVINERAAELVRNARAHCGVYWGTYLLIEDAMEAARKAPFYDGAEPNDPRFVRWNGDATLGVQLQGGEAAENVDGKADTRLRIEPGTLPPGADPNSKRSLRRRHAVLALRIGSEGSGRDPIWARWPMVMHRPLPPAAVIKRAAVSLRMCGPRAQWSVTITVVIPDAVQSEAKGNAVAIDIGWRKIGDAVRIAVWRADDGTAASMEIQPKLIGQLRKADELRSTRDDAFGVARAALVASLGLLTLMPEWLRVTTKTLVQWRSPARLASLARRWRDARFTGDEEVYAQLEAWRYHDFHLWEWETSQRLKALRHRREEYRCFAASLARKYKVLVLEDFNLSEVARRPAVEDAAENETARSTRQRVAVSEFRAALMEAFFSRGGQPVLYTAADTTRRCHSCLAIEHWDQATELVHTCSSCGDRWDQDDNAVYNLLRMHRDAEQNAGVARDSETQSKSEEIVESRWERARRLRGEKEARTATARS